MVWEFYKAVITVTDYCCGLHSAKAFTTMLQQISVSQRVIFFVHSFLSICTQYHDMDDMLN